MELIELGVTNETPGNDAVKFAKDGQTTWLCPLRSLVLREHKIGVVAVAGILIEIRLVKRRASYAGHVVEGVFCSHLLTVNQVF